MILIKDIEMPKRCMNCMFCGFAGADCELDLCQITGNAQKHIPYSKMPDCPLIEVPEWIPVTERLPEEYKNVLCYYEYFRYGDFNCMFRTIDRGYYGNGIWGGEAGQGHKNKVFAWMPLPEPPKEE